MSKGGFTTTFGDTLARVRCARYSHQCPSNDQGQSGRKAKEQPDLENRRHSAWREIPVEELRRFMAELVADSNLREAGRLIGRGREAVRRFVGGDIETPHDRTREAIARLYLQKHGAGEMAAAETPQLGPSATPLKLILPQGAERATAEIRQIFDGLRKHSAALPASAAAVETWLPRLRVRRPRNDE
jgi:hypothetical protein